MKYRYPMRPLRIVLRSVTVASIIGVASGCTSPPRDPTVVSQSTARPAPTQPASPTAYADVMADRDAEIARQAALRNRPPQRTERPIAPNSRQGAGVVDQPRVGTRP